MGHDSEAAGRSPASASSLMNVAVLKYGSGKSGPVEVIRMKYHSGSGLPAIANGGSRIQDTAGAKAERRSLGSWGRKEPSMCGAGASSQSRV